MERQGGGEGPTPELWGFWRGLISTRWRVHALFVAGLVLSGFIYNLAMVSHFNFDDYQLIVFNPSIRDFRNLGVVISSGHPVRGLTLMLDYALFGLNPRWYHVHNVLWHIFGSILFYALGYRIFGRPRLAGAAAVLFAFHPIHTEAVMAVAHRKDLLAFAFMLLAFHAYLYRQKFPKLAVIFSLVFFALALLSKQVAMVLPALILVHEWLKAGAAARWRAVAWAAPLLILAAALIAGGIIIEAPVLKDFNPFGKVAPAELNMVDYGRVMATSFSVFPRYLRFLLFPVHQCLTPLIKITTFADPRAWLGVLMFLLLPAAGWLMRRDQASSFSLFWIFLTILPVMNWVPANDFFAERYLFTPSAGFCLLAAALWERLHLSRSEILSARGYGAAGLVILLVFLWLILAGALTIRINVLWPQDGAYLMDRAQALATAAAGAALFAAPLLALLGSARSTAFLRRRTLSEYVIIYLIYSLCFLLAAALAQWLLTGHFGPPSPDVESEWAKMRGFLALRARPGPWSGSTAMYPYGTLAAELGVIAVFGWGVASLVLLLYSRLGRYFGRIHANRKVSWEILLLVLLAMDNQVNARCGDWASEVRLWRQTVMEEPGSLWGWNNLGKAYMDRKRYDLATDAYLKTTELDPKGAGNYRNLGLARLGMADLRGAEQAFARAIRLAPGDITSRNNLANILVVEAERGGNTSGFREAIMQYLEILRYDPRNAHAHHNLAWCYYRLGNLDGALSEITRALALNPGSEKSRGLRDTIMEAQRAER